MLTAFWRVQAALVAAWWGWLLAADAARAVFAYPGWPEAVLLAFALPDGAVLVFGSLLAAATRGPRRVAFAWLVCGGATYAFLWCLAASCATGGGWLGTAAMAVCALANGAAARSVAS